jgi:hypothetical protein
MSKSLVVYSTVIGEFLFSSPELTNAMSTAIGKVGEDVWKKGFSANRPDGATVTAISELKAAGLAPVDVSGIVKDISYGENVDGAGKKYPKLRVNLTQGENELFVSLDLKSEVAQRMIAKLGSVNQGDFLKVSAWASPVERGGRTFINHAVSIKDSNGAEVRVDPEFSGSIKSQIQKLEGDLQGMGVSDKIVINTAKTAKRMEIHKNKLSDIEARLKQTRQ